MSFTKILKREAEVAFSKQAQPVWFRILKYSIVLLLIYFFRQSKLFWIIFFIVCVSALLLHFWVRYKTNGWTKSYGLWKYDQNKPKQTI